MSRAPLLDVERAVSRVPGLRRRLALEGLTIAKLVSRGCREGRVAGATRVDGRWVATLESVTEFLRGLGVTVEEAKS